MPPDSNIPNPVIQPEVTPSPSQAPSPQPQIQPSNGTVPNQPINPVQPNKKSSGKKVGTTLVIVVILIVIGIVGWMVYKNHHKTNTTATNTSNSATASTPPTTKSFCSSTGGLCLDYPNTWTLKQVSQGSGSSSVETNTITSPSGDVAVQYIPANSVSGDENPENSYVAALTPTKTSDFEAVSLINTCAGLSASDASLCGSTSPATYNVEMFIYPTSSSNYPSDTTYTKYIAGTTMDVASEPNIQQFNNPMLQTANQDQELTVTISAKQNYGQFSSLTAAKVWLSTSDAKTAAQILASLSYKQ